MIRSANGVTSKCADSWLTRMSWRCADHARRMGIVALAIHMSACGMDPASSAESESSNAKQLELAPQSPAPPTWLLVGGLGISALVGIGRSLGLISGMSGSWRVLSGLASGEMTLPYVPPAAAQRAAEVLDALKPNPGGRGYPRQGRLPGASEAPVLSWYSSVEGVGDAELQAARTLYQFFAGWSTPPEGLRISASPAATVNYSLVNFSSSDGGAETIVRAYNAANLDCRSFPNNRSAQCNFSQQRAFCLMSEGSSLRACCCTRQGRVECLDDSVTAVMPVTWKDGNVSRVSGVVSTWPTLERSRLPSDCQ